MEEAEAMPPAQPSSSSNFLSCLDVIISLADHECQLLLITLMQACNLEGYNPFMSAVMLKVRVELLLDHDAPSPSLPPFLSPSDVLSHLKITCFDAHREEAKQGVQGSPTGVCHHLSWETTQDP